MNAQSLGVVGTLVTAVVGAAVLIWRTRNETRSGAGDAYVQLIEKMGEDRDADRSDRDQWKRRAQSAEDALRDCQEAAWQATALLREIAAIVRAASTSKLREALEPFIVLWESQRER